MAKTNVEKLVSPALMWSIAAAGILAAFIFFDGLAKGLRVFTTVEFYSADSVLRWMIIPAFCFWVYFFAGALKIHKEASQSVAGVHKIITKGVYGKVRHPIYDADIVLSWGIFLLYPNNLQLVSAIWISAVLIFWMGLEEKFLIKKFGKEYKDYCKKVPMIIPKFNIPFNFSIK